MISFCPHPTVKQSLGEYQRGERWKKWPGSAPICPRTVQSVGQQNKSSPYSRRVGENRGLKPRLLTCSGHELMPANRKSGGADCSVVKAVERKTSVWTSM
ncbi:hypothetical protein FQA47_003421 [Oryzias melastigma]|uniref:Uncharacterized protein n=1 Tax=Oryzias melastigma TaxID=30732 RepID=A0A834CAZ2_ORYME|nr:hypothetical protein FQA47_003421 [Oryzias melastigma]